MSAVDDPPVGLTTDTGTFAIIPTWLLYADVSDRALRLYGVLARYADSEAECYPSRKKLAGHLRCSVDSVDRATAELVDAGAVSKKHRHESNGDQTSNLYVVCRLRPGGRTGAVEGGRTGAAQTRAILNESQQLPLTAGVGVGGLAEKTKNHNGSEVGGGDRPWPASVNRKPVTKTEGLYAVEVLGRFNTEFETSFTAHGHLTKIIMRLREHPELVLDEHFRIIERNKAAPWWKGEPSPAVIYGNDTVFEQAMRCNGVPVLRTRGERKAERSKQWDEVIAAAEAREQAVAQSVR